MTNEQRVSPDETQVDKKLNQLEGDVSQINRANDINNKIDRLENSLDSLQGELEVANKSVAEGMDRLSDNDLDITAKVSETYKRLGKIDNTYKTLSKISDDIDSEVKKLTTEMEMVVEQSAAELDRVESSSSKQIIQVNEQHKQLVGRVNELVKHSRETNKELSSSIEKNTKALLDLEKQLLAEIDSLANTTQERDDEILSEVGAAKLAIESNKAKIIQMQSVDEALAKRANTLEIATAELTDKTRKLDSSVDLLDARTSDMSEAITKLQKKAEQQATLIKGIQRTAEDLAQSVLTLTGTERFHFRSLSGALLLVLLLVTGLYFYQQGINTQTNQVTAERSTVVDQQVVSLQQQDAQADTGIAAINDKLVVLNEKLEQDIKATNAKITNLNDQTDSLDGRLNRVSPFSQFGLDNIIHGPQWLAQQSPGNFVIQLASVSDKKSLYEIAQRYSYHLKQQQMAYFTVSTPQGPRYVLTYGSFTSVDASSSTLYRMPHTINHQQPIVARMSDVQRLITM